ncbi:MAG: hypothetical protein AAF604_06365 [Acidobacteriota bacterium]
MNAVGEILASTVVVSDLEHSARVYGEWLGLEVGEIGTIESDLAVAWRAPATAGRRCVDLWPSSGRPVPIRLVEVPESAAQYRTLRSYGWAALEITVQDADALAAHLADSPFRVLGPPKELALTDRFYPFQVAGPDGEVLYLNEVRGDLEDFDLPRAASPVDHLFIAVLASPNLEESLAFYRRLGFATGDAVPIAYTMINQAFGFPADRTHELAMVHHGRRVNVEVDQYPAETEPRPTPQGLLPGGIACISLAVESLGSLPVVPAGPILQRPEPPFGGRRSLVLQGAAGEMVELVEVRGGREAVGATARHEAETPA